MRVNYFKFDRTKPGSPELSVGEFPMQSAGLLTCSHVVAVAMLRMSAEVVHTTSVQLPAILRTLLKNHDFLVTGEKLP